MPTPEATTRIVHLSDPHFGAEDPHACEAALEFIAASPPDLVVVTGDLTLNGLPREFEAASRWLARLPASRLVTPGNHDTPYWNLPLRALRPFSRYARYVGSPDGESFTGLALTVQTLNTARGAQPRPDWSKGAIDLDACRAAVALFAASAPTALKVLACHHPLIEAADTPVSGGVHRGRAAVQMLAAGGADLILTGHVHNPFSIATPFEDHRTYAVGAGTLSKRLRGVPPSFNEITANADTLTVTAFEWTGSQLKAYRTWASPRRLSAASDPVGRPSTPR